MFALFVKVPTTFRLRKISSPSADPKYLADHGPLQHISAGDVIQQRCSINKLYSKYVKINSESAVRNSENLT